jgi:hypothetical protein
VIRKSGKIRAANSRINEMTSLDFDILDDIDGICTLLALTTRRPCPLAAILTSSLRKISI